MPVDKFGRMSDAKTRDTGVSLTYINNNYTRSDGNTPVSSSINMNGKILYNVSDPVNPQDVTTKEYVDYIKSILHKNIVSLFQLYITLGRTQEENKEKINKPQEEINKTREEINERIDKTQKEINERIDNALALIKEKPVLIMAHANYQGRLKEGKYQFNFLGNIKNDDENIGFLMPNSGRIKKIILKTPYDHSKSPFIADGYDVVITSFLKIEVKSTWREKLVKSYFCNLYYDKIRGKKPDHLKDKVRKLVMYDVSYEYHEIKTDT